MPDHVLLDDVACPHCASPLVSIEAAAADDRITRGRIRRANLSLRWIGVIGSIIVVSTAYQIVRLLRDGGSAAEWQPTVEGVFLGAVVVVPFVVAAVRLWGHAHTRRTGRLATCHACGHRWPLL
ncbi:MAG: hypothetical protein IPG72_09695 [Ardenticatenales bacterium]|nr:hypothetical protein [Ardenticatenales bacterium]